LAGTLIENALFLITVKEMTDQLPLPLHQSTLEPKEIWGRNLQILCGCGHQGPAFSKRCSTCRKKNEFTKVLARKKRIEKFVAKQLAIESLAENSIVQVIGNYKNLLLEVQRRPLPQKMKNEELKHYLTRVDVHFSALFKSASPSKIAHALNRKLEPSAWILARNAWQITDLIIGQLTGLSNISSRESAVRSQADRLRADLLAMLRPYLRALKTLQIYHSRLVENYSPVKVMMDRFSPSGRVKSIWSKAKEKVTPAGQLLRFGTAIWENAAEKEQLQRFDVEYQRFIEQIERFSKQCDELQHRQAILKNTFSLSLRKHILWFLCVQMVTGEPQNCRRMISHLLAQKGISRWPVRWWYAMRHAKPASG
jgi:hypothetical protein